jgi:hypothetical protein
MSLREKTLLATAALLASPMAMCAQGTEPPTAPLPAALSHAKKIFLGNAGDQENADCLRAYNEFYRDIAALNRFEMAGDPAEADLVLELHYEIDLGGSLVSSHDKDSVRQFRVAVIDPHTHTTLWSLTERTNYAIFQKNRNKNLDQTVDQLAKDFDSLTASEPAAPNNKSRVTH